MGEHPTVLLRVAGMPCAAWTSAADPALFERIARHAREEEEHTARARALAERLGTDAVPHPALTGTDRRAVLALRRRLHAGHPPAADGLDLLDRLPDAVPPETAAAARALAGDAARAGAERAALERAVADGQRRAAALARDLAHTHPVLRDLLDSASPGLRDDIDRRLADGEPYDGKALRKRTGYIWRVLGRAAAKTTPRGWAGQLAQTGPGPTGTPAGTELLADGTALGALAGVWTENVHLVRARPPGPPDLRTADPGTLLAPAPLHFTDGPAALRAYVVDPREPGRLRHVALRRTPLLGTVLALLAEGPRPLGDLEKALLALVTGPGTPDATVLRGFLQHLHTTGLLQVCAPPRLRHSAWLPPGDLTAHGTLPRPLAPTDGAPGDWYLDSYRTVTAPVPAAATDRVRKGLRVAARIAALRDADTTSAPGTEPPELAAITEQPRPVSEILAVLLPLTPGENRPAPPAPPAHRGWPPPAAPTTGYARLLAHLAAHPGPGPADVDDALLDALGAPPADEALPDWPLDCLLRPLTGPGPAAVLETGSAAGVLDARFADGLGTLYGAHPAADAHRAFLAAVEHHSGVRFVELLVPPLAERAANAVRRPVTTGWWTGDPDPTPYYGPTATPPRYLPLDRITLRRAGGRIVAEADGRRVVPVHHATRSPLPPYDTLLRLLLRAGHPATSTLLRLDGLDAALPGSRLPRVTAAGELVLAPATWRVDRARLWRPGDDTLTRARALTALRAATGLPRHVFLRTAAGAKPVPADLDALTALPVIDRLCAREPGAELLAEEMLPAPGDLPLRDPLHGGAAVAAQLLLRIPYDPGAAERLAARAARALTGGTTPDVPGTRSAARGRTAGAATAHQ
ncbi:lantibiotic dehydratase [Streptomyces sp. NPDC015131]|uniref:lantibiotic dehydratase n=1 Tax=Streptomyces sp. NPDC015131 TaxID=3364941 RepID=UPI0036F7E667